MSSSADALQAPLAFLKWSMERYQALASFQAECLWHMDTGFSDGQKEVPRTLQYVKPNRYRVVSGASPGFVQVSICDGKQAVDYTLSPQRKSTRYPAPISIADADTMSMKHPMSCGSLLYPFFGGPDKLYALADMTQAEVQFGAEVLLDGYACKTVRFVAGESYGQTEIAISTQDGLVRRICYGNEPLIEMSR